MLISVAMVSLMASQALGCFGPFTISDLPNRDSNGVPDLDDYYYDLKGSSESNQVHGEATWGGANPLKMGNTPSKSSSAKTKGNNNVGRHDGEYATEAPKPGDPPLWPDGWTYPSQGSGAGGDGAGGGAGGEGGEGAPAVDPKAAKEAERAAAKEAALLEGGALETVLQSLSVGEISSLPKEVLLAIPPSLLAELGPDVLAQMPEEVQASLAADLSIKSERYAEMVQLLPIDKVAGLPWARVINSLKAAHVNRFPPATIGAIPWHETLPVVEPDLLKDYSISVLQIIPPTAWAGITFEQLDAMDPNKLKLLPLSSVLSIPVEHWMALDPTKLSPFDIDVVKAISPDVLAQASTAGVSFGVPYTSDGAASAARRRAWRNRGQLSSLRRWN